MYTLAGKLMCRYLLRRCDNSPAPWDSGTVGDGPWLEDLPEEATEEMKEGQDVHKPSGQPHWDYDATEGLWKWVRPAPVAAEKKAVVRKPTSKREAASVCISL
jgi:E3 ubiquitin-protein ligase UHRF1